MKRLLTLLFPLALLTLLLQAPFEKEGQLGRLSFNTYFDSENTFSFVYPAAWLVSARFEKNIFVSSSADHLADLEATLDFESYQSIEGGFNFAYPSPWKIESTSFTGGEIIKHIGFSEPQGRSHGFFQVWQTDATLSSFLKQAQKSGFSGKNIEKIFLRRVEIAGRRGYRMDYQVQGNDGASYHGAEAFFSRRGKIYRLAYFTPADSWDSTHQTIFKTMVDSIELMEE
jgi:hypothetical protein